MVARWFESTAGDVGTRQREGRAMTRFVGTVAEFASEHAGHTLVILATEVMAVTYSAWTDDDGEVRSCWESEDEDVVETREQNLGCQSCGVFDGPSIDGDDVRYGA